MYDLRYLYSLAPNFKNDRDEDWMVHLPLSKRSYLSNRRADLLAILEQSENHALAYKQHLIQTRNSEPHVKLQAKIEFEEKKKKFDNERDELIRELIPVIKRSKALAQANKERSIREAAESLKRRQPEETFDPTLHPDVDPEIDDYLPNYLTEYMPRSKASTTGGRKKRSKSTRNDAEDVLVLPKPSPIKKKDTLLEGIEDSYQRKVLNDLRTFITTNDCRDRVLNVMNSIQSREVHRNALDLISSCSEMVKNCNK